MSYSEKFEQALVYAARVHSRQDRKGSSAPYITHLLAVAALVGENGGSEDQVIAALLHDAPEDQGGRERLEDVKTTFGGSVARIVSGCTDSLENPKPTWRPRKEAFIRRLREANDDVILVVLADKVHNASTTVEDLREFGESTFDKFTGKKEGTLWYYREVYKVLSHRAHNRLTDRLRKLVEEMHKLAGASV